MSNYIKFGFNHPKLRCVGLCKTAVRKLHVRTPVVTVALSCILISIVKHTVIFVKRSYHDVMIG
jgi:hypothetical protein